MSKSEKELLESTMRGRANRAERKAGKEEGQRKSAAAMEEAKPVLKARPGKPKPSSKTKYDVDMAGTEFRKGGKVKAYAKGGSVSSRADGIAQRGKTRGKIF
jgi:hypothetical protein